MVQVVAVEVQVYASEACVSLPSRECDTCSCLDLVHIIANLDKRPYRLSVFSWKLVRASTEV